MELDLNTIYPGLDCKIIEGLPKNKVRISTIFGDCILSYHSLKKGTHPLLSFAIDKSSFVVNMFKYKHGDKYNYSKVMYTNARDKVDIICPIHGMFSQLPKAHSIGKGCVKCGIDVSISKHTLTKEVFINRVCKLHGNKYSFEELDYKHSKSKVIVTCKDHGPFEIVAGSLLEGKGCYQCGKLSTKVSIDSFKKRASDMHRNKFNYNKISYNTLKDTIAVHCPMHGEFTQKADVHLHGGGCPICSEIHKYCSRVDPLKECSEILLNFYILQLSNEDELFWKIGITQNKKVRFRSILNRSKYNVEVLFTETISAPEGITKEKMLLKKYRHFKYTPKNLFGGSSECFNVNPINFINETLS